MGAKIEDRAFRTIFISLLGEEWDNASAISHGHLVWDEWYYELTVLPTELLRTPNFQLTAWYAAKCRRMHGLPKAKVQFYHTIPDEDLEEGLFQNYLYWVRDLIDDDFESLKFCRCGAPGLGRLQKGFLVTELLDSGVRRGAYLPERHLVNPKFSLIGWIRKFRSKRASHAPISPAEIMCSGAQIPPSKVGGISRAAFTPRIPEKVVAKPLVIVVRVNGEPLRALV
ncbi:hypothetical protein B0H13DRAFT_2333562 [Mycena leptocephala]|nr:hypothetical protein B0H13DRAFT_2333562 [Mycena leptocephala]